MLKALLRKDLLEIKSFFFQSRKKGMSSGKTKVGMIILYVFLFLVLAASFTGMSLLFFDATAQSNSEWIAWTMMSIIAVFMCTMINSFTSYVQLYLAKDNEFLLSMPIPPNKIVITKLAGVYIMGMFYELTVMLPTTIIYWIKRGISFSHVVLPILITLLIGLLVVALTCYFGWVIAYLSTKLKNQKVLVAVATALFICVFYVFQFRSGQFLDKAVENIGATEAVLSKLFFFPRIGLACCGDIKSLIIVVAIILALFYLGWLLLSKTFIKVATTKHSTGNAKFKESEIKTTSLDKALFNKEKRLFLGSTAYMLNCGLGLIFMLLLGVFALFGGNTISDAVGQLKPLMPDVSKYVAIIIAITVCLMESMTVISAPSISIEGNRLWILKSLPVDYCSVLRAKCKFAYTVQGIPAIVLSVILSITMKEQINEMIMIALFVFEYSKLTSAFGVMMNLKKPKLDWVSETVAIKQNMSSVFVIFGGMILSIIIGALYYFVMPFMENYMYILIFAVIFELLYRMIDKWYQNKGRELFADL